MDLPGTSESKRKTVSFLWGKMNRQHWLVILLLGLLLMVIAFPISKTETETENQNFSTTTGENMETKTDLEMKLEDLLKNVEGVGNVKVNADDRERAGAVWFWGK